METVLFIYFPRDNETWVCNVHIPVLYIYILNTNHEQHENAQVNKLYSYAQWLQSSKGNQHLMCTTIRSGPKGIMEHVNKTDANKSESNYVNAQ